MLQPDRKVGRPGIYGGFNPEGDAVLVKVWPRSGKADDSDLEEIWRHEIRQLHRLAGYPGALNHIAHLYQTGIDRDGFYLVLDPGQRRPLQTILDAAPPGHWLRQPRQPRNRGRIWQNLKRIALALETLHSQGLLHRNLDSWAILSAGDEDPDFQLTGFEWSMRIVGAGAPNAARRPRPAGAAEDSFLQDWLLFGLLAADLLGVDRGRLLLPRLTYSEVAEHVTTDEARLLRNLVQLERLNRLDGDIVAGRIDEILSLLASQIAGLEPRLHLVVRLGVGGLADSVREASGNEIESDDRGAQLAFVRDDLGDAPLLLAVHLEQGGFRLVLRGNHLLYQLRQYLYATSQTATWDFAYCDSVQRNAPAPVNIIGTQTLDASSIEIMESREASGRFALLRGKLRSWEVLRQKFSEQPSTPSPEEQVHRALTLTQFLEALYAAADVFPVEVLSPAGSDAVDGAVLRLRSRADPERDELAEALGLRPPTYRLDYALANEAVRGEGWILTDSNTLGERNPNDTEWQFERTEPNAAQTIYVFSGTVPTPALARAFLIPQGSVGRDVQFRRRLKALRALKDHGELMRMLADPRRRILDSHDLLVEDEAFLRLDEPKREALRELTSTIPLYLVQGPPGVGKTRLVRDLTRRRFAEEATTRLLLTAQSNAAVDHLMDELAAVLQGDAREGPLVVRCRAKESDDEASEFDVGTQARRILKHLSGSPLAAKAPASIRRLLDHLVDATESSRAHARGQERGPDTRTAPSHEVRAFEGVVVRAANMVFATTNSGELERLIEERAQFDWAIVEEAGKATGSELISPLLLSHRRLMIGDHKQLPPFGSDDVRDLLKDHGAVRRALLVGDEFVGRSLRDETTDEILDDVQDEENRLPGLCAEAMRVLVLFESMIEDEFRRQASRRSGRSIAKKLTLQHRMHPAIARLVSRCFYNGELDTHPDRMKWFKTAKRPFVSTDPVRFPTAPIVVLDMPYVQETVGQKTGDRWPRWHNPDEVDAVIDLLSLLRAAPNPEQAPSLAVLSPYSEQVRRLKEAIKGNATQLANLSAFESSPKADAFCGTVDSFQGNEADLVVISLVRNNHHGNVHGALGFLTDFRRMNVLLSRARWQLVLVASLAFLRSVVETAITEEDVRTISFLIEMLDEISDAQARGVVQIVKPSPAKGTQV